jgi:hypothetical protein
MEDVPTTAVPFDHEYAPPEVIKLMLVVVQVNIVVVGGVIVTLGALIF